MKLFDNNPQSKAMQSLIHDSRNSGDTIRHHVKKLQDRLKELSIADTRAFVHMEYIKSRTEDIEKAIDAYYERFSNDFVESGETQYKPEIVNAYHLADKCLPEHSWTGDKMTLYKAFDWLVNNYTLIRKPNSEQNDNRSIATEAK